MSLGLANKLLGGGTVDSYILLHNMLLKVRNYHSSIASHPIKASSLVTREAS